METFGVSGQALWASVNDVYELEEHERALLIRACQTADHVDDLAAIVAAEGVMSTTKGGDPRAHPALVEHRQQSHALAQLIAQLRLPQGVPTDHQQGARPQRRGVRGTYLRTIS